VLVWAFIGIAQKQSANSLVATSSWIAVGLLALVVVLIPIAKRRFVRG
jgi:hypothetical protein